MTTSIIKHRIHGRKKILSVPNIFGKIDKLQRIMGRANKILVKH